jgi:hypothetical protein
VSSHSPRGIWASLGCISPYKRWTGGPVSAHHGPYEFIMDLKIRTLNLPQLGCVSSLHFHTLTQDSTSTLLPEPERRFYPKTWLLGCFCLWELIKLFFYLLRQV